MAELSKPTAGAAAGQDSRKDEAPESSLLANVDDGQEQDVREDGTASAQKQSEEEGAEKTEDEGV
eukprot:952791-Rhodomonas_salina.1